MKRKTSIGLVVVCGALTALILGGGAGLMAAGAVQNVIPIWNGHWNYLTLGPSFRIAGSVIDVPTTQGAPGTPGGPGPAGPPGVFAAAANQVYVLTAPQTVFGLTCGTADIYRNGLLQSEGGEDYAVDATGLVATMTQPAQVGDVIKIVYRCP